MLYPDEDEMKKKETLPCQGERIIAMSLSAQAQGLKTLDEEEGAKGIQRRPDVTHELYPELHCKSHRSECLTELKPMIPLRGGRERREFVTAGPIKLACH